MGCARHIPFQQDESETINPSASLPRSGPHLTLRRSSTVSGAIREWANKLSSCRTSCEQNLIPRSSPSRLTSQSWTAPPKHRLPLTPIEVHCTGVNLRRRATEGRGETVQLPLLARRRFFGANPSDPIKTAQVRRMTDWTLFQ